LQLDITSTLGALPESSLSTVEEVILKHQTRLMVETSRDDLWYMRQVGSKTFWESLGQEVVGMPESTGLAGIVEVPGIQDWANLLVKLISANVLSHLARLTPSSKRMTVPYSEE
jgi:hypothetical protein